MIEGNADPENRDAPTSHARPAVLAYAPPNTRGRRLTAKLGATAAFLFPVGAGLVCAGLNPHLVEIAFVLSLPVVAVVLGAAATADRGADRATLSAAQWAKWMGGVELCIAVVFLLLLAGMGKPREAANRIKCASNLRQIGYALQLYAQTNGGPFPPSFDEIVEVDIISQVFVCPSSDDDRATGPTTRAIVQQLNQPGFCSYIYALSGSPPSALVTSAHVVAHESLDHHSGHRGELDGINVLYGDGLVKWLPRRDAEHLIAELNAGHNPPRPR